MKRTTVFFRNLILFLLAIHIQFAFSQTVAEGIPYQTIVRNSAGLPLKNQQVRIRTGIYKGASNGPLQWEETHSLSTDQNGLLHVVIGKGVSTGNGSAASFWGIEWATGVFYLHDVKDVKIVFPAAGQLLKWKGLDWMAATDEDSDTVYFAKQGLRLRNTDTSVVPLTNTVSFAIYADTSKTANSSGKSQSTIHTAHTDTAVYALSTAISAWELNGNTIGTNANQLGTADARDFLVKTK